MREQTSEERLDELRVQIVLLEAIYSEESRKADYSKRYRSELITKIRALKAEKKELESYLFE